MATNPTRLSKLELAAWSGFLSTHAALTRAIDAALQKEHGMSFRVYDVLATLDMPAGGTLRMSECAARLVLSPSRSTRLIASLEERGWVNRRSGEDDGRVNLVELTEEGLRVLRKARRTHHAVLRERFLDRLSEDRLATLAETWRGLGTTDPGLDEALRTLPE